MADNPRNKTDDALKLLADRGGVVGVYFMPWLRTKGDATAADVIQHMEHALKVCGEDHVGIGTDGRISPVELTAEYRQRLREEVQRRQALGVSAPGEDDVIPLSIGPERRAPPREAGRAVHRSRSQHYTCRKDPRGEFPPPDARGLDHELARRNFQLLLGFWHLRYSGILSMDNSGRPLPQIDELRGLFKSGRLSALGEVVARSEGLSPSNPALEPYFALAEELDIPVGNSYRNQLR